MIKTGPKPKTPKQRILAGNPGKRAINRNAPKPTLSTSPLVAPSDLPAAVRKVWERLALELHAQDCLTAWDVDLFRVLCLAVVEATEADRHLRKSGKVIVGANGYEYPSPWIALRNKAREQIARYGSMFGLNPTSRGSMDVSTGETRTQADDDFACEVGR